MKIVNKSGKNQPIPFSLGERGQGAHEEEIRVDRRRPPLSPDDVGYHVFEVGGRQHCVLTAPNAGQSGLLVRINTDGCYTKYSQGSITLLAGDATRVAHGAFSYGLAGRCGGGPDELWHAKGRAVFSVVETGGSHKGYGTRHLIVDAAKQYIRFLRMTAVVQDLVTDEDPILSGICREFAAHLPAEIQAALQAADELEEHVAAPDATTVRHYISRGNRLEHLADRGIRLPPGYAGGYRAGPSNTLLPGEQSLVMINVGPGGGKRYGFYVTSIVGVDVVYREPTACRCASDLIVGLVTAPDWEVSWTEKKDGELTGFYRADAQGYRGQSYEDD